MLDLPPCWWPLFSVLNAHGSPIYWQAGAYNVPEWTACLTGLHHEPETAPKTRLVTCATARHEAIEALRWARSKLARGIPARDIAIAAASPGEYDDLLHALAGDAGLPLYFAQGRRALTTRDGQAAAALADLLLHGLSRDRVRRLTRLAHAPGTPFGQAPPDWESPLPEAAPLDHPDRWRQALGATHALLPAIALLAEGAPAADRAGATFLRGPAAALWRRALTRGPAAMLETTLGDLRVADPGEAATSIGWMHAASLATCPRPHVRLLGLNARLWPRASREDPLLPAGLPREHLRRSRAPDHAMSEPDRLAARPAEFALTSRARSAEACWQDWNDPKATAHDGLVRADHPVLLEALARTHSAGSLKLLLRNPLGFVWKYALGWREPEPEDASLDLDRLQFGLLVHAVLDAALPDIVAAGGIGRAPRDAVAAAVGAACGTVAARWEVEQKVPPALLWEIRQHEARRLAVTALCWPHAPYPGQTSRGELMFGEADAPAGDAAWDAATPVVIPGTDMRIRGRIDRLDLATDGRARVVDYKTGEPPDGVGTLAGGAELQRCLYACAVRAVLGDRVAVEAALLYLRDEAGGYGPLDDADAALQTLTGALLAARRSLRAGQALPGPDTGDANDPFAFALPAGPASLLKRKQQTACELLGEAAAIWGEP